MIALNVLLAEYDKFDAFYKRIGFSANLEKIKDLEQERKVIGLEFEKLRSENNKASAEIANLKNDGKSDAEISAEMKKITTKEREIKRLKHKFGKYTKSINSMLKKLKNLPDEPLSKNSIVFEDYNATTTFGEALDVFKNNYKYEMFGGNLKALQKKLKNRVFSEDELMYSAVCSDGMTIFCDQKQLQENFEELLRFFCATAVKVVKLSDLNLADCATVEYKVYLKDRIVSLQKVREFYSREYNIKYRDKSEDITHFVQQIIIKPIR